MDIQIIVSNIWHICTNHIMKSEISNTERADLQSSTSNCSTGVVGEWLLGGRASSGFWELGAYDDGIRELGMK